MTSLENQVFKMKPVVYKKIKGNLQKKLFSKQTFELFDNWTLAFWLTQRIQFETLTSSSEREAILFFENRKIIRNIIWQRTAQFINV